MRIVTRDRGRWQGVELSSVLPREDEGQDSGQRTGDDRMRRRDREPGEGYAYDMVVRQSSYKSSTSL